ncbi:protein of unknown function (plasmid) [Cupriavidus taiwanensis]|uniref:Uncharacterized protein n=1 Tax=Cupriavidus taiwanensis TaxID=164546 RepID=A0A375HA67_9BURK|nr:protein of unknown function [Cupriavidus taiwanensis]SPA03329.1 protein of unknown function [Cupriavidus taiwanensis]SPA11304.1 protein of unknown function [Cupriavidus taiwanensis]SPD48891.1 protein of unknown function [Cupriavidus taiwanensis]
MRRAPKGGPDYLETAQRAAGAMRPDRHPKTCAGAASRQSKTPVLRIKQQARGLSIISTVNNRQKMCRSKATNSKPAPCGHGPP